MPKGIYDHKMKGKRNPFYGRKHTEESKRKMSEKLSGENSPNWGKKHSEETKKKIGLGNKGKKLSQEQIERMRKANLGKKYPDEVNKKKGSPDNKNPRWIGGELRYLKKKAKLRDDFTCQVCGLKDEEIIEVDHIKMKCENPELTNSLENLITLCPNCHRRKTNRDLRRIYTGKTNEQRKRKHV